MSRGKFSKELAKIPYGVSVVTVGLGGRENGLTVSWLSQVSFDPPMLMISIDKNHYSTDILQDIPSFVVNLLQEGQSEMAAHFARQSMSEDDKIDGYPTKEAKSELPILTSALCYYDCEVVAIHEAGDHFLVIGEVTDAGVLNDGRPMTSAEGMRYLG